MTGSLVRLLMLRLLLATGIALLATGALLLWQFEHSTTLILDRGLGAKFEKIAANLVIDGEGRITHRLSGADLEMFHDELFFTVGDEEGMAVFSVPPGREQAYHPFETHHGDEPQFFEHNYLHSGENYLGMTQAVTVGGATYWVQLVEEVPYWESFLHYSLEVFLHGVGILILLHFIGSALLARATLNASFEPVARAAEQARAILPGQRDQRIETAELSSEIAPLATAANAALDRLDKALSAQKRFTADAAHELLTPVAIMKASISGIEDRQLAETLSSEVEEMTNLVTQLLELSELEAEGAVPSSPCDLHAIASDVLTKLAPLAIGRGIEPELTGDEGPVIVHGCPKTLHRAISNLVKNVIQHARGATQLEISVKEPGRLEVRDNGPGIPPEMRERVFERFRRGPDTSSAGSGLGLSIVKRIIEAHEGRVYVTDGPGGKGASFVVELAD